MNINTMLKAFEALDKLLKVAEKDGEHFDLFDVSIKFITITKPADESDHNVEEEFRRYEAEIIESNDGVPSIESAIKRQEIYRDGVQVYDENVDIEI
jgi:hypothetical protein